MSTHFRPIDPPTRILLGPGPSDVAPSVARALAMPTVGHLDPEFLRIMDQVREMLRTAFRTPNELPLPMSGTGSAGMETCFVNLIEPGDEVLVGVHGVFGGRMAEVAERCGARVTRVEGEWGRAIDPQRFADAAKGRRFKALAVVHAETSTGVLQPIPPLREVANECGALLIVDCVTSLAGCDLRLDDWGIDAAYSGTQKCLSCPPGLSPVSLSERARDVLKKRKSKVPSWYLDLGLIASYWGGERAYHHTAPINMIYGLHEALRLALEEGLEARFERHARNGRAFAAGLRAMGLAIPVPDAERLPQLTPVTIPHGVEDGAVRGYLLREFGIEIGGGLGPMKGKAWRIGLMGAGSTRRNVLLCLGALRVALTARGHHVQAHPLQAANDALSEPSGTAG